MKKFAKWVSSGIIFVVVLGALLFIFGPYEKSDLSAKFDASVLGDGVESYFATQESRFDDITPGVQKQVIWAEGPEQESHWSILYVHGFSATAQEIRPVPDQVAAALGANLVLTRLTGHGRDGAALADATVADWMADLAEGLAVARLVGERVLVISASTGGTLATAAALDPKLAVDVAGLVLISPNYGLNTGFEPLLTLPAARYWLPPLAGAERSFEPANEDHATYWTTSYPSVAVLPMAALVKKVANLDVGQTKIPALFWYSKQDRVVRPEITSRIAGTWGGPVTVFRPTLGPSDDAAAHVIAGDIMSPGQNETTVQGILDWVKGL